MRSIYFKRHLIKRIYIINLFVSFASGVSILLCKFRRHWNNYEFADRSRRIIILLCKLGAVTESVDVPRRLQSQPSGLLGHAGRCAHRRRTHRCKTLEFLDERDFRISLILSETGQLGAGITSARSSCAAARRARKLFLVSKNREKN